MNNPMRAAALYELFGFGARPLTRFDRTLRIGLFCFWLATVLLLMSRHVMWRDEVRAYSLALQGDSVWQMLEGLRGDGHPALWHLILRVAHSVAQTRCVLPAVAMAIGAGAMLLLTFRSPFRPLIVAIILTSGFGLYTFVVVARNYGISMLLLFAIATLYGRFRDRGFVLPILVFLLCNCNAHSLVLAAGFLVFWFLTWQRDRVWERQQGAPPFWSVAWLGWQGRRPAIGKSAFLCRMPS